MDGSRDQALPGWRAPPPPLTPSSAPSPGPAGQCCRRDGHPASCLQPQVAALGPERRMRKGGLQRCPVSTVSSPAKCTYPRFSSAHAGLLNPQDCLVQGCPTRQPSFNFPCMPLLVLGCNPSPSWSGERTGYAGEPLRTIFPNSGAQIEMEPDVEACTTLGVGCL